MNRFQNRYVLTGTGVLCCAGNDVESLRQSLLKPKSNFTIKNNKVSSQFAAGFVLDNDGLNERKKIKKQYLAEKSLYQALEQANLNLNEKNRNLILISPHNTDDRSLNEMYMNEMESNSFYPRRFLPDTGGYALAGYLSKIINHSGLSFSLSAGCASSNISIYQAILTMESTNSEIGIVSSATISPNSNYDIWTYKSLGLLNDYSFNQDKPFYGPLDHNRSGLMLSEGGATIVIETLDHALKHSKNILAEVVGYGHYNCSESSFISKSDSIEKACRSAIENARLRPLDIDFVNLHATGTLEGDKNEVFAMSKLFSDSDTFFNTTKGHIGHAQEISGLIEIIGNLDSFKDDQIHPCSGITCLDSDFKLKNIVIDRPITHDNLQYFMNFNSGVYGQNNALIFKKWV